MSTYQETVSSGEVTLDHERLLVVCGACDVFTRKEILDGQPIRRCPECDGIKLRRF